MTSESETVELPDGLKEVKPFDGSRIVPVIARACSICVYSAIEGKDLVCRRNPPQVTFMAVPGIVPGPLGKPQQGMQILPFTTFPIVRKDQYCGEFGHGGRY
jgi:hypothetical protein